MKLSLLTVLVVMSALAKLASAASPPAPSSSEYFTTTAGMFTLQRNEGVLYSLTFQLQKELSSPVYVVARFENPSDKKAPMEVTLQLNPGEKELNAKSPTFRRIKNGKSYVVELLVYEDEAHAKLLSTHKQKLLFNMPAAVVRQFGVELE